MQHTQRIVFLVLLIGWTIFRLVRYVRVANSKRPAGAVPPVMGAPPPRPAPAPGAPTLRAPAAVQSPIEPEGRARVGRAGLVVAAATLVGGSALVWAILFAVPEFDNVPTIWRLTAGVFATLLLIRAASVVARAGSRSRPPGSGDDRNPIK